MAATAHTASTRALYSLPENFLAFYHKLVIALMTK